MWAIDLRAVASAVSSSYPVSSIFPQEYEQVKAAHVCPTQSLLKLVQERLGLVIHLGHQRLGRLLCRHSLRCQIWQLHTVQTSDTPHDRIGIFKEGKAKGLRFAIRARDALELV
jgi:hypothetical protein